MPEPRQLGSTGIRVSAIGLGMAAIGRPAYLNLGHADDFRGRTEPALLEEHAHTMLDHARAAGITYFDAARSYGRAEDFLESWLEARQIPPHEITIGSKWGYSYVGGWRTDAEVHEIKDHGIGTLMRQRAESIQRLGSHLGLFQVHSITPGSEILSDREVIAALAEMRDSGLPVGFTTSGPRQADVIRDALEVEVDGRRLFDTVQATWNLLETSAEDALAEAAVAGVGVIVKEALANGRLTARDPALAATIGAIDPGWPIDAVALAAVSRRPWASVTLSGAATCAQLMSNLRALEVPDSVVADLPTLAEDPADYWATRSGVAWT